MSELSKVRMHFMWHVLPGGGGVWQRGTVSQDVRGEGAAPQASTTAPGLGWAGWAGLGRAIS